MSSVPQTISPPVGRSRLEEYEGEDKPPYMLTYTEVKLLGIAGVSFLSYLSCERGVDCAIRMTLGRILH